MANLTGSNKGRKWMSKDGISKMVLASEINTYLAQGWAFGHITDNQKAFHKKWYNNGKISVILKDTDEIPLGFVPGRLESGGEGNYKKFKYRWYTNGSEQIRISETLGQKPPEGWWPGQADWMAEKSRQAPVGKHRTEEQKAHHKIGAAKAWAVKLQKNNYTKSKLEDDYYEQLCTQYGADNVVRQYIEERYPWHCDFYIKSEDLFIELNKFPTHYSEPFDKDNPEHIKLLKHCQEDPNNWIEARMAIVWAGYDVKKREWALAHNLNFKEIY